MCTCGLLACAPAQAQRLPTTVIPEHYDLAFDVDLKRARFGGVETIRVRLAEPTRRIVLHALDVQFQEVTVTAGGLSQRARVTMHEPSQTAALTLPRDAPAGTADIHIRYTGTLNASLRGFYLSEAKGRRYAVTQLESTDARRAFPSFDEPAFKATFSLQLTIDEGDTAISNGRVLSDEPGPGRGRHTVTFSRTPKMSSYLVAMAVGDFKCIAGESEKIPLRVCAVAGSEHLGRIALDATKWMLPYFNRYYSIRYPFDKLDMVAIPDFAAGAMENTAAIFYREADLLAEGRTASVSNVKRIWSVIAHELAHQWFGNLVTMGWWDDLWLNEGFATWMEKRSLAEAKPEWKMAVDAAADTQAAMNLDALASTRAIHAAVETPDEIEASFDTIAYEKGAAVMRMIEGFVGPDAFRRGVNAYLERFAYGNATSRDFWTIMAAATGRPVDRILPTFVNQPGVPLVQADLACEGGRPQANLSVDRFFTDPAMARRAPGIPQWQVPICSKIAGAQETSCRIVTEARERLDLGSPSCVPWTYLNAGAHGYFRTAYPPAMLRALAPALSSLTDAERLMLAGDEWALVRANRHTIADYLSLASGFAREPTSGVLREVTERLTFVHTYLADDASRPGVERFIRSLLAPQYAELGNAPAPDDTDDRRTRRAIVIETLGGAANDDAVATAARTALDRLLAGGAELDPTTADALVAVAARQGDTALWERLVAASKAAAAPAERYRYLHALAGFGDAQLIDRGLNLALTDELRSQDTPGYIGRFLTNPAARERAWAFIKQQWPALKPKIVITQGDVRLVQSLGAFCDAASRDEIRTFVGKQKLPAAVHALDQTIERIDDCMALKAEQARALQSWLEQQ
jgi:aminopeptidase N